MRFFRAFGVSLLLNSGPDCIPLAVDELGCLGEFRRGHHEPPVGLASTGPARVWGLGFGVWGLGFGVWGLGFRV